LLRQNRKNNPFNAESEFNVVYLSDVNRRGEKFFAPTNFGYVAIPIESAIITVKADKGI